MSFWYEEIWAEESGGHNFAETATVNIPSSSVLVSCALQQVNQQGGGGQARMAITQYVQDGDPHEGNWQIVNGSGITSVTFALTVNNAAAQGTGLIQTV
ncbi:MAG TPA: hypothetical protein VGG57_07680 [Stellaceae bacterium]|jgi:hypothetical protein